MRTILNEIDLHLIPLFLLLLPISLLLPVSPWFLLFLIMMPQGIIFTRFSSYYPTDKRRAAAYLLANETLVTLTILIHSLRL